MNVKCLYRTSDRTVAQLLSGALEAQGIRSIVRGEHLSSLQGAAIPAGSADFLVCIVDPEQLPKAELFVAGWLAQRAARPRGDAWTCAGCGERHEAQFVSCWNCGAERGAD